MRQKQDVFLSVFAVALLAEGVDRNCTVVVVRGKVCVALREEGVDRNTLNCAGVTDTAGRPPRGGRG